MQMFSPSPKVRSSGFTTVELLIAVSIASVLSGVAYPSFRGQVEKSRRADAVGALMQTQMAEERWRANQPTYGSLADIGMPAQSSAGYYMLRVASATSSGYLISASARGTQDRGAECRNLRLAVDGANFTYASGPDESVANPAPVNRRCWSL